MYDKLVEHLEKSSHEILPKSLSGEERGAKAYAYVATFLAERPPNNHVASWKLEFPHAKVIEAVHGILSDQRFHVGKGPEWQAGVINGRLEGDYSAEGGWLGALPRLTSTLRLNFQVTVSVSLDGTVSLTSSRNLPTWVEEFRSLLAARLGRAPLPKHNRIVKDPILPPSKPLSMPFEGTLLDYSGCADEGELADLRATSPEPKALPLGIRAFGFTPRKPQDPPVNFGEMLYLNPLPDGSLREHQGTLICAPQNSGKTELIVRWAQAANRLGYNLLLVDIKGNLYDKLKASGWQGDLHYFTTNPREIPGSGARKVEAVNFLADFDLWRPESGMRIAQLAAAIMPRENTGRGGEDSLNYEHRLAWLTSMIQVALVDHSYRDGPSRAADLSDVHELAASEGALVRALSRIDNAEHKLTLEGKQIIPPGFATLFDSLSVLITQQAYKRSGDSGEIVYGQRAEYSYRWLTEGLVTVLRPFAAHGTLYSKISGRADVPHFTFEALTGLNSNGTPNNQQVSILLAARSQDMEDSRTILALAMARLEQALWDRMEALRKMPLGTVLLLLDETRRIRNFKTNEYVTFAREAQAGCVVAYQSLEQIGTPAQVVELLENIGTQIYLGSLSGGTARSFISNLPKRYRPRFSHGTTEVGEPAETLQTGHELVDYFSSADLFRLPAGEFPALVYLNDQQRRKPFLVTMEKDRLATFLNVGGKK